MLRKQQTLPLIKEKLIFKNQPFCMSSTVSKREGPSIPQKSGQRFKLAIYCVAIVGGLLFGYNTGIIAAAIPYISAYFNLEGWSLGWAVGCMLIGCAVGSLIAGILADRFGRRKMLIACAIFFVITGPAAIVSHQLYAFTWSRIIGGLGVGAIALLSPLYLAELAPSSLKGPLIACYQTAIITGILLAYFSGSSLYGAGPNNWSWMLASQFAFPVLFGFQVYKLPEMPYDEAKGLVLSPKHDGDVVLKLDPIPFKDLFDSPYRDLLFIGILVAVCQQVTGINVVLYYAPLIFKEMGADAAVAFRQTIFIGVITLAAAVVMIFVADKMNRKNVMLWGIMLMGCLLAVLIVCFRNGYVFGSFLFLLLYVAAFSCTLGTVTWLYLTEIFPGTIRGRAMSIAILALWLADFAVSASFPAMYKNIGMPLTLLCYLVICIIFTLLIYIKVQETKGPSVKGTSTPA